QSNHNRRRNQQRSYADSTYLPFCHLTTRKTSQLNFSAFNSRAYTVKLTQKSPTLLSQSVCLAGLAHIGRPLHAPPS
ncbi:MAG: hypothetical protein ACOCOR_04730, partial [Prevotella sp.]